MTKFLTKADILLIIALILVGLLASYVLTRGHTTGDQVVVTVEGKVFGSYSLLEDRDIDTHTGNIIRIEDGTVFMKEATCYGHDCMEQGKIQDSSRSIICLPHKVVVKIEGGDSDVDTIAR